MINGDMQSNLYTASRAMHSHILGLLQEGGGSAAAVRTGVGKLANLQVAVQRRWSNMMTDAIRQQVVEMFLGLKWGQHFGSVVMVHPADLPLEVRWCTGAVAFCTTGAVVFCMTGVVADALKLLLLMH